MRTPQVSERGREMPASPMRKLAPLAEGAKARGLRVIHLNIGQPDLETPACMRRRLHEIEEETLAYTPSNGLPEFLGAMREYYARLGIEVGDDEIIATTGGSEALLFAFTACAGEGDEIIVPEPFYANYRSFAAMSGVRLVPLRLRVDDGFHLPPASRFESLLTPRTKAVLLCNPNNPTGTVYAAAEMEEVADFCRSNALFLISDEVYREFSYDGDRAMSALELEDAREMVVVCDSLSKRYSACGIRLGTFITRNPAIYGAALRMAQGRLSAPGLAQQVASAVRELGEEYVDAVVQEYEKRRNLLYEGLATLPGVFFRRPEGAFYFVARLPVDDADKFAAWLLSDYSREGATVMLAPASGFYETKGAGGDEVRIAYVLGEADLALAVRVLEGALREYPGRVEREERPIEPLPRRRRADAPASMESAGR